MEYLYLGNIYTSEASLNEAILDIKNRLDNKPTDYCFVQRVECIGDNLYKVENKSLTDSEINNLSEDSFYTINSYSTGDTFVGLNKQETEAKILEFKIAHATAIGVNTIISIVDNVVSDTYTVPLNIADMSVYLQQ